MGHYNLREITLILFSPKSCKTQGTTLNCAHFTQIHKLTLIRQHTTSEKQKHVMGVPIPKGFPRPGFSGRVAGPGDEAHMKPCDICMCISVKQLTCLAVITCGIMLNVVCSCSASSLSPCNNSNFRTDYTTSTNAICYELMIA